ncbi:MAG: 3-phosphoshikimate 1-carboxyvinyltransferase [Spirochaetaceae bacterium]|jgi:3-phosphoshikimate 1-carboxyvinyltransferase|nr:3-phosphoshikimate 1-carboxyvinyltransferase [Spirochaetaceae bacterium]
MDCISSRHSLEGEITVPGSKSHTIRAVLLGVLSGGATVVHNPLDSGDGLAAVNVARAFGAQVEQGDGWWRTTGTGRLRLPDDVIHTGNSGTATHFALAMASLCEGWTVITGDEQIRRRPVADLLGALNVLGAQAWPTRPGSDAPPVILRGGLRGGEARLSGFSSQPVSALLLAAGFAPGPTVILVDTPREKPYIRMTLDWLARFGLPVPEYDQSFTRFAAAGVKASRGAVPAAATNRRFDIPADWSAAAFPLVAAVCTPSKVTITGLDFGDTQGDKEVADILISMGADIRKEPEQGRVTVYGGKPLMAAEIDLTDIPDGLPALVVAAAYARGDTHFTGLAHVRVKETDRVDVMARELSRLGVRVLATRDTLTVHGGEAALNGGEAESHGDHRVAMALAVAGLFARNPVRVSGVECVDVSFPGFFTRLNRIGAAIRLLPKAPTSDLG